MLSCSLAAELLLTAGLLTVPAVALPLASALLTGYAHELSKLDHRRDCQCFGRFLGSGTVGWAVKRNVILALAAVSAGVTLLLRHGATIAGPNAGSLGFALVFIAAFFAAELFQHMYLTGAHESASRDERVI
jgi:hypothetical protein